MVLLSAAERLRAVPLSAPSQLDSHSQPRHGPHHSTAPAPHSHSGLQHTSSLSSVDSLLSLHRRPSSPADSAGEDSPAGSRSAGSTASACVLTFHDKLPSPPPFITVTPSSPELFSNPLLPPPPLGRDEFAVPLSSPKLAPQHSTRPSCPALVRRVASHSTARTVFLVALCILAWSSILRRSTQTSSPPPAGGRVLSVDRSTLSSLNHKAPFQPPKRKPPPPPPAEFRSQLHRQHQQTYTYAVSAPRPPPVHESLEAVVARLTPAEFALREWIFDVRVAPHGEHGSLDRDAHITGSSDKWHVLLDEEGHGSALHGASAAELDPALASFVAETTSILSLPSVFSVGVHLDPRLAELVEHGELERMLTAQRDGILRHAQQLAATHAQPEQRAVYFLAADTTRALDDAADRLDGPILISGIQNSHYAVEACTATEEEIVAHTDARVTVGAELREGSVVGLVVHAVVR